LYKSFKQLRRCKAWKDTQHGGAFMLEVKLVKPRNTTRRDGTPSKPLEWHPHLHVIAQGSFVNIKLIQEEWHRITADSWLVDVRVLPRENDVAAYVSKYVTKGTSPEVWNHPEFAAEWIEASKGIRTCDTFGTWRGFGLTKPVAIATDWTRVGSLVELIRRCRQDEEIAWWILSTVRPPGDEWEDQLTSQ
jgi:hypothetical protein